METVLKLGTSLFLGFSFIFFVSPLFLYWFIHGNSNRYVWIINGPYPFSNFGGGPYQLWMGIGLLIVGVICLVISLLGSYFTKRLEES